LQKKFGSAANGGGLDVEFHIDHTGVYSLITLVPFDLERPNSAE